MVSGVAQQSCPHSPSGTVIELLTHTHVLRQVFTHSQNSCPLIFESDSKWHSAIIHRIPVSNMDRVTLADAESILEEELLEWNPSLVGVVKCICILIPLEGIVSTQNLFVSLRVSLATQAAHDFIVTNGVLLLEKLCQASAYTPPLHSQPHSHHTPLTCESRNTV